MVKDGSAMERLVEIDTIVFDKTGTLTMGLPGLRRDVPVDEAHLAIAARIGAHSHHPYAQALAAAAPSADLAFATITEHAGRGLEDRIGEDDGRLGRGDRKAVVVGTRVDGGVNLGVVGSRKKK